MSIPTIIPLNDLMQHIVQADAGQEVIIKPVSYAPRWLRWLYEGGYCVYKNVIYVPDIHMQLLDSKSVADQELAMATIIQYHAMWYHGLTNSIIGVFRNKWSDRAWHTFIYTYMLLKMQDNPHLNAVITGYLTSRKKLLFGLIPIAATDDEVLEHFLAVQDASKA